MSVRNRVLPAGNQRVFGVAVIASIMVGAACHNGVETPIGPSVTSASVPTATSAALAVGDDTATTRGGPISVVMTQMNDSGFSGTCTLGAGGAGFRIRASGQGGVPGQQLRLFLWVAPTATDPNEGPHTDFTQVDDRGNFRFSGERVTFISSGRTGTCEVTPHESMTALAQSDPFTIP
jgi:hypothetical protein